MINVTKETNNGLKFGPIASPENGDEFDKLANRKGAYVEAMNNDVWYRGVFPDLWYALALRLNKEYPQTVASDPSFTMTNGFEMKAGPAKKDGTPRQVRAKSDPQHVDWIAAKLDVKPPTFQQFVDEIVRDGYDEVQSDGTTEHFTIVFDPSAAPKSSGPAKPGKEDIEKARILISQNKDGMSNDEALAVTLGKISATTGQPTDVAGLTGEDLVNRVALYVRDFRFAIARAATSGLMGDETPAPAAAAPTPKKGKK